jgi:hypothetical protein
MIAVAVLVLVVLGCLLGAGAFARIDERRAQREIAAGQRQRELARKQFDKLEAMKLDGTHLFRRRGWKPAIAYLAPERVEPPKPANVQTLRRAKR